MQSIGVAMIRHTEGQGQSANQCVRKAFAALRQPDVFTDLVYACKQCGENHASLLATSAAYAQPVSSLHCSHSHQGSDHIRVSAVADLLMTGQH